MRILSVTELTRAVKSALETCFPYPIEVEGEITNFRPHYSGHAYFALKDSFSELAAVMWKSRAMNLTQELKNGQRVVCSGNLTVYEKTGRYQLNVLNIRPLGQGDLQAQLEALKIKLWEMGYFDEQRKRPIPAFPKRVGLITSPTGAALRDLIAVAQRRNPGIELILRPSQVQGADAAADLVKALQEMNQWAQVDVIILGRGGGSIEDLWAFNDENLAREIFHSQIPVVSAVGHEIDVTISDLVADRRAATPSAAAELVIPKQDEMLGQLLYYQERGQDLIQQKLKQAQQQLQQYQHHYALRRPQQLIEAYQQKLNLLSDRMQNLVQRYFLNTQHKLEHYQTRVQALNPQSVLERGFIQLEQSGQLVLTGQNLHNGSATLHFKDGPIHIHLEKQNDSNT